jgi:WD40 repeat protein
MRRMKSVTSLAVLPDGKLVSGSFDRTVRIWENGTCCHILKGHTLEVTCLAVLPDGMLASGSDDLTVRVWENGVCLLILSHISHVKSLTVLPDGRLAVGLSDIVTVLQDGSRFMGPSDEAIYVYE